MSLAFLSHFNIILKITEYCPFFFKVRHHLIHSKLFLHLKRLFQNYNQTSLYQFYQTWGRLLQHYLSELLLYDYSSGELNVSTYSGEVTHNRTWKQFHQDCLLQEYLWGFFRGAVVTYKQLYHKTHIQTNGDMLRLHT